MCLLKATAHVLVHREVKSKEGAVEVGSSTGFAEALGRGGSDKRPLLWCHTIYTQFLFFQRKRSSNKVFLMVTRLGERNTSKPNPTSSLHTIRQEINQNQAPFVGKPDTTWCKTLLHLFCCIPDCNSTHFCSILFFININCV